MRLLTLLNVVVSGGMAWGLLSVLSSRTVVENLVILLPARNTLELLRETALPVSVFTYTSCNELSTALRIELVRGIEKINPLPNELELDVSYTLIGAGCPLSFSYRLAGDQTTDAESVLSTFPVAVERITKV
jgi:hypothetical protein